MKAIVFGGSGFVGSHVADALASAGHEVTIFDRRTSPYLAPGQRMIVGDILRHARAMGLASVSLVAVNGSLPFWYKHGFRALKAPELEAKLGSYEAAARYMVKRF